MFDGDLKNPDFKKFAEIDGSLTMNKKGTGLYQCYCTNYKKKYGSSEDTSFCFDYTVD